MLKTENINFENPENNFFIFGNKELLLKQNGALPSKADFIFLFKNNLLENIFLDTVTSSVCGKLKSENPALSSSDALLEKHMELVSIREFFSKNTEELNGLAARNYSYLQWNNSLNYCSFCGEKLQLYEVENAKICPKCGKIHYPRIEPCIIVLISKGDELLLLKHKQRSQNFYACLAGFIEAGETVEQAVRREVKEEVNLNIKNISYAGSQGWPFPDQLMLAFYAEYESGEIKVQESEIQEARWFNKDCLPECPKPGSVAWRLIHHDF